MALQVVTVNQSNIAPKECVMYSKTTQTMGGGDREDRFGKLTVSSERFQTIIEIHESDINNIRFEYLRELRRKRPET